MKNTSHLLVGTIILLSPFLACADDWPQWLGPQRDGVWRESGIIESFPKDGPKIRWRTPIGGGYAGPSVVGNRVYVADRQLSTGARNPSSAFSRNDIPGTERILCLDESNGQILWKHEYDANYTMSYAAGPRVTPIVSGGKVFALGGEGHLVCLDAATGKPLWLHDFKQEYQARTPMWGFASNPLLDGNKLICLAGGQGSLVVAFDKDTGRELWRSLNSREPGYSPPTIVTVGGHRQLIIWEPQAVHSLDPETGRPYWSYPWQIRSGLSLATPRLSGDLLFLTSFYTSSRLLKLDADKPAFTVAWEGHGKSEKNTDTLHSLITTPFIEDGYIYGVCSYGQLRCVKLDTGDRLWEDLTATGTHGQPIRWATAFIVKQADRFWIFNEKGDLIIAKLSPKGYQELSKAHLIDPDNRDPNREVVWSHPAFANRCVYVRNDQEIVCASLAGP
jgi:outer membrane protein assembly factor BamB